MRRLFLTAIIVLVVFGGEALAQPLGLTHTFSNPSPANGDKFGHSVSGAGNKVLVGAPNDATVAPNAGAAYLYDATTGAPLKTFFNPDLADAADDLFGYTVAMVGDNVLIGAPFDDALDDAGGVISDAGVAYLFDGNTGFLLHTFVDPTPADDEQFGVALAGLGNNVLVGAPFDNNGGTVYLFDGSSGDLIRAFDNPTPDAGDEFGSAIASVGGNVLVGSPFETTGNIVTGAAYLFNGTTGSIIFTLVNPNPASTSNPTDSFGKAVAAVGNDLVVAAPGDDAVASNAGVVYLFSGTTGALFQTLINPTALGGDAFGTSVAGVGSSGLVLVGTPSDDPPGVPNAGSAYLLDGTTGTLIQTLSNPDQDNTDNFGSSVAAVGNNVLIGTPFDELSDSGIAYFFASPNLPPIANAGGDQTLACTSTAGIIAVTLDGSASRDPDNDLLTYTWRENGDIIADPTTIPTSEVEFDLGTHTIELTVNDGNGGTDTDVVLIIVGDTTPPIITLNGVNPMTLECNAPYTEPGAMVSDACDPSPSLVITGTVNPNVSGTYTITYTATDARGNSASTTRTVNVVVDATAPTITLNGANPMILGCNAPYNEPGAVVSDVCDPSPGLVITGTVDANVPGIYTITYTATDARGNSASTTRTVNVIAEATAPIITLNGANPMTLECHASSYTEPGAQVSNDCNFSSSLAITGTVNVDVTGAYTITYTATDASGNNASATRTVNVVDTTPPTIRVKPPIVYDINSHQYTTITRSMSIASITDGCAGTIAISQAIITKVTSDEPDNMSGGCDGYTTKDIVILFGCKSVNVRKERKCNGNGRVYTIYWNVSDPSGNVGTAVSKVKIRFNGHPVVDNGPVYTVNGTCGGLGKDNFTEAPGSNDETAEAELPEGYALMQNYPNPFNPETEILFQLPEASEVVVKIFNTLGAEIRTLADGGFAAGSHALLWDGRNHRGEKVQSGVYFYRLATPEFNATRKMILAK